MKNPIPIANAKTWTKKWQVDNPNHAKAFLMHVDDLLACITEMGLSISRNAQGHYVCDNSEAQLRAYLGIDVNNLSQGFGEKLVFVGTVKDGATYKDIVEDGSYPTKGVTRIGSGAFDLTTPCPNDCDTNSSLYHKQL